jgi:hypothetical protein
MLIDRRTFVGTVAAALAGSATRAATAVPWQAAPTVVHIVVFTGARDGTADGFRVGSAEAQRVMQLLKVEWRETVVPAGGRLTAAAREARAGVLLAPHAGARLFSGRPIVAAIAASGPRTFSVRASAAARDRALARWRQRDVASGLRAVEWHPSLDRFGAEQLNVRLASALGQAPDADVWAGWMAAKVVAEAAIRAGDGPLSYDALASLALDGHKGMPLRFDAPDRYLRQPLYIVDGAGALRGTVDPLEEER